MKKHFSARTLRAAAIAGVAAASLSTTLAFTLAGHFTGAIYTTDEAGVRVNQNIFQSDVNVYLNGGPNNANSAGLPPGETFYFEVTDPSGQVLLSTDEAGCRMVTTGADGRIFGSHTEGSCATGPHIVSNEGGNHVKLAPFNRTPNNGGEYKVTLVRMNANGISIEDDGMRFDYPRSAAKSDNFKVLNHSGTGNPQPTPTVPPTPTPTPGDTY